MDQQRRTQYLDALGIQTWVSRASIAPGVGALLAAPDRSSEVAGGNKQRPYENIPPSVVAPVSPDWETLQQSVATCTACGLHTTRTQTVFGVGNRKATWMVIGEAPGADEDAQGEPFVGRAGKLLNEMLRALGLPREQVYIANMLKCLRYNALVQLGDGSWERIGRLVRARYDGDVMCVDAGGRLVRRKVTGWHETPVDNRRVFRLSYRTAKHAGKSRICIQLTGDHPVLTQRGYVAVEQLGSGDRIATGQGLSPLAFDVVCGTLLGDGHLAASQALLSFGHSAQQRDYALFKAELLSELSPSIDERFVAAVVGGEKSYSVILVRTRAHRVLRILRKDFYPSAKQVPAWIAEKLNARMLAIWFMDDGYTRIRVGRQPSSEIATCGFSESDLAVLLDGLRRLGLHAKAIRGRLHFDVEAARQLSECIAPFVPPSMRYKLHPEVADRVPFEPDRFRAESPMTFYDDAEVEDITHEPRTDKTFFCIDVDETHNFVTAGGVVHNCRPPNNRDPQPEEVAQCEPYLQRQVALIQPKIILAVGRIAAQNLLKTDITIGRLRGRRHSYGDIPLVVTYHPAYLLRSPAEKRKAWDDLRFARAVLAECAAER